MEQIPERTRTARTPQRAGARAGRGGARPGRRGQTTSLSVPQVGIASALGLATIAAPLTGVLASPVEKVVTNSVSSVSMRPAPAFPLQSETATVVEDLRLVPDDSPVASVPSALVAPRAILVARVSRASERPILPGCDGVVRVTSFSNGKLPAVDLCTLWDSDHELRADAAIAAGKLNLAYRKRFGHDMCLTDGYRTLAQQIAVKSERGSYAATPGTSNHGLGVAVDLCDSVNTGTSATYWWLRANAPTYGWNNPAWALPGGSGPHEPWHWEYFPGETGVTSAGN